MTLLDVLRHQGHNVRPHVDPQGKIHFLDNTVVVPASMTPVKPHTFHGGEDNIDAGATTSWWEEPGAMEKERAAVALAFPGFVDISDPAEPPRFAGEIDTGFGKFTVAIVHRRDHGLPAVVPIDGKRRERRAGRRYVPSPHLYVSGLLCVAEESDWDPSSDTSATVIAWAAHWHAQYVVWRLSSRQWLSEGYHPNAA
ncbi:hypothetical protein [Leifsonia shinshuensis]|uniref:hypothetical protein n=1 Tax=Leifsonia shinshuensis TaxID=150026 RepID=UPI00285FD6A7|nr:hypothetical protein [Leifsonia shinshuensis]MDR6972038.1 hypothetical protein [Leifsonia shinshuensis]